MLGEVEFREPPCWEAFGKWKVVGCPELDIVETYRPTIKYLAPTCTCGVMTTHA